MKQKILLIDDDTNVARFVKFRLEKNGYDVRHIDNGIDGLDEIRDFKPNMLILDMMMSGLDGREVAEKINEEDLMDLGHIIMLSGKEDSNEVEALFDLGIHDYLKKPFKIDTLLVRIERVLAPEPH